MTRRPGLTTTSFQLSLEELNTLRTVARRLGVSASVLIRWGLQAELDRHLGTAPKRQEMAV